MATQNIGSCHCQCNNPPETHWKVKQRNKDKKVIKAVNICFRGTSQRWRCLCWHTAQKAASKLTAQAGWQVIPFSCMWQEHMVQKCQLAIILKLLSEEIRLNITTHRNGYTPKRDNKKMSRSVTARSYATVASLSNEMTVPSHRFFKYYHYR